jgi:circadian clock protein KaiC
VVDGVILLSLTEQGLERQRYLEVYKLRNTAHLKGRHTMSIGPGGITIFPRYTVDGEGAGPPPPVKMGRRVGSGVTGLDPLLGGGLFERSVTLVSGSTGIGKSTLGLQFVAQAVRRNEPALYVSLEEGPAQILETAEVLGLGLSKAIKTGLLEVIYLSREYTQASQFLAILADRIKEKKIKRVVLDSVSHIVAEGRIQEELQQLLFALVARFKGLGATTLLTLESKAMHSTEAITDYGLSPVADNLILLRYSRSPGEIRPTLAVIKTRGSAHDFGTYHYEIGKGGIHIGERLASPVARPAEKIADPHDRKPKRRKGKRGGG